MPKLGWTGLPCITPAQRKYFSPKAHPLRVIKMKASSTSPDLARIVTALSAMPHCQSLGLQFIELRHGEGQMRVPFDRKLIGNPQSGVVHGGVITMLLDTLCGAVVLSSIPENTPIATLDLRIDYLHPTVRGKNIHSLARCYKVTANIAFARGLAYHDTKAEPIAHCVATYMLGATGFTPSADAELKGSLEDQSC